LPAQGFNDQIQDEGKNQGQPDGGVDIALVKIFQFVHIFLCSALATLPNSSIPRVSARPLLKEKVMTNDPFKFMYSQPEHFVKLVSNWNRIMHECPEAIDQGIYRTLVLINQLDGLVTKWSCEGHEDVSQPYIVLAVGSAKGMQNLMRLWERFISEISLLLPDEQHYFELSFARRVCNHTSSTDEAWTNVAVIGANIPSNASFDHTKSAFITGLENAAYCNVREKLALLENKANRDYTNVWVGGTGRKLAGGPWSLGGAGPDKLTLSGNEVKRNYMNTWEGGSGGSSGPDGAG
jgi:hypothetical protein